MKLFAFIIAMMLVLPSFGQRKREENISYDQGVAYALPRTVIKIHVKAVREKFEPGPYAAYAEDLLGITNAKTRSETKWSIKDVTLETYSEPDPNQVYKAAGYGALVSLASNGCIAGINTTSTEPISQPASNKSLLSPDVDDGFSFDYLTDTPMYTQGDSTNDYNMVRVGMAQKAAQAAKRILESRMNQYDMAALMMDGEHPDGKAYEVSMKELKKVEQNYIKLFVGRTTYKTEKCSFDYVPETASQSGQVAFRISNEKGLVPASDLSGSPVQIVLNEVPGLNAKYTDVSSENLGSGKSGVYYRMPGIATVRIIYQMTEIASLRTPIAQFGVAVPLSENLLDGEHAIEYHPETGAIKSATYIYQGEEE